MKKSIQNQLIKLCLLFLALVLSGAAGWAQRSINGTVSDESGQPLPGVSVVVKGTTIGAATNMDGKYVLEVPANAATIVFSFIGMKNQEEQISGRTTINVVLTSETIGLDEVVAVGYGVQKKATLTGSVGNIKSEELLRRPAANTTDLLTGTISGLVTRQSSGIPGGDATTLNIRGFSSSPLVIIDGIEGTLGQIDPNDIESISVLKDASAAVYGARAGNGVILVTTKRGSEMDSRITYHGTVSYTQPTFLPNRVGAAKWAEMLGETGLDVNLYTPAHIKYDKPTNTLKNTADGSNYEGYDWTESLMRDWTPQQQHNLSATGGTQKVKYFISAGFTDQESNFKSGDYDYNRYNIRSNIDAKINESLSISADFSYRTQILDKANFTLEDMYNSLETAKPVFPVMHENDPTRATYSGFLQRSPYAQTFKSFSGSIKNRTNVIQGALELKYSFPMIKGLAAKARFTYEEIFGWDKTISKPFDVWEYNQLAAGTPNEWIKRGTQNTNRLSVTADRSIDILPLISLEYEKRISDHYIKGIIIGETRTLKSTSLSGSRKDLLSYEAPYLRYASQLGVDNNETANEVARAGVIGRINYDYKGKYILEVAMRADASAEYPETGRWGFFPSISGGWRLSEESFIKDNFKAIDNLKLRASYGVLGYDAVSSFAYLTGYLVSANSYIFGTTPAPIISSAGLPNPDITWETMTLYNVGFDGNFWNGLLGFEADVFYRLREDILATPDEQVPSTFGASLPQTNINKRDNRGFELSLLHKNKVGKLTYEISPKVSWSRGKFVDIQEDISATDPEWNARYVNEGQWDDRFWAYESDGLFMSEEEIANHPVDQSYNGDAIKNNNIFVGDIKYKDLNGDGIIDWHDEKVIGKTGLPKTMYSLNLNGQFKGFSVDMLFQGGANYRIAFSGSVAAPFNNESIPLEEHYTYRAIVGLDGSGKKYITNPEAKLPPVFQNGQTPNNRIASDYWSYDAKYLRLKSLNISYTIPSKLITKYNINQCTFYVSSSNLWTISNLGIWKNSFDPEVVSQNSRNYPPVKTVSMGLKLTL